MANLTPGTLVILLLALISEVKSQSLKPGDACYAAQKYGTCPVVLVDQGFWPCTVDGHCSGVRVCCPHPTNGHKYCSDPFESNADACPPSIFSPSTNECYLDNNCGTGRKCCPTTPGSYCEMRCTDPTPPTDATPPSPATGTIPPTEPPDTPTAK